jgi:hypothetical protein
MRVCFRLQKRKILRNIAHILQSIWLKVRKRAFNMDLRRVEVVDSVLNLFEGDYARESSGQIFYPFPTGILQDPEIEKVILLLGTSGNAIRLLHNLAKELLKSMSSKISPFLAIVSLTERLGVNCTVTEIEYQPDSVLPLPRIVDSEGKPNPAYESMVKQHNVLEVDLDGDERWIIDIAGAPHGFKEILLPFKSFLNNCVLGECSQNPFGTGATDWMDIENKNLQTMYKRIHWLTVKMVPNHLEKMLDQQGITFNALARSLDDHFQQNKNTVLRLLDEAFDRWYEFMSTPAVQFVIGRIFKKSIPNNGIVDEVFGELQRLGRAPEGWEAAVFGILKDERELIESRDSDQQEEIRNILFS